LENKGAEQALSGTGVVVGAVGEKEEVDQTLDIYVSKCKNDKIKETKKK
jgi:hypothetical protein